LNAAYAVCLNRTPDAGGLAAWLASGVDLYRFLGAMQTCAEYAALHGTTAIASLPNYASSSFSITGGTYSGNSLASYVQTDSTRWLVTPGTQYQVQVRSKNTSGNFSAFSATASLTIPTNSTALAAYTSLSATAGVGAVALTWPSAATAWPTTYANYDHTLIFWSTTNTFPGTGNPNASITGTAFTASGLTSGTAYYFWICPVDTSGNIGTQYPSGGGVSATPTGATVANGTLTNAAFAPGYSAIPSGASNPSNPANNGGCPYFFNTSTNPGILYTWNSSNGGSWVAVNAGSNLIGSAIPTVSSLPTVSGYTGSTVVLLSTDNNLYRLVGGSWTAAVPAVNLTGSAIPTVSSLPSTSGYTGSTLVLLSTDGNLYRLVSGAWTLAVPTSGLTAGTLPTNVTVTATNINVGSLAAISANLGTVTSGTLTSNVAYLGTVNASQVNATSLSAISANLGTVTTGTLTSGTSYQGIIYSSQISTSSLSAISANLGTVTTGTLAAGVAYLGTLNASQITAGTISASMIGAGTFQTASSGKRVVLDGNNNWVRVYDGSSNVIAELGGTAQLSGVYGSGLSGYSAGGYFVGIGSSVPAVKCFNGDLVVQSGNITGTGSITLSGAASVASLSVSGTTTLTGLTTAGYLHSVGYGTRAGINDSNPYTNNFNIAWGQAPNTSGAELWIDGSSVAVLSTSSDYRLKDNVEPLTGGLGRVNAMRPILFDWRNIGIFKDDGQRHRGFIAHEIQEVIPTAARGTKDGVHEDGSPDYQAVNVYEILPDLVSAIQELAAKVAELRGAQCSK